MAKKKNNNTNRNKWILIAGVFVVLFLLFYMAVPRQKLSSNQTQNSAQTPIPTDWQTHVSSGVTFRYPKELTLENQTPAQGPEELKADLLLTPPDEVGVGKAKWNSLDVRIFEQPLSERSQHLSGGDAGTITEATDIKNSKVNGYDQLTTTIVAKSVDGQTGVWEEVARYPRILISDGKTTVDIIGNKNDEETLSKIASSVKFTQ